MHTSRYEAQHSAPLKTIRFAVLAQGVGTAFLFYDANGRLYKTVDYQAGLTHLYEYDSLNRLIFAWQKNSSGSIVLEVQNAYDELGRAKGSTYVIGDTTQTYGITYEDITGLVKSYTTPGNSFTYTYDVFDRLTTKLGSRHSIQYTYVAGSQRVSTYTISQADASLITYSYTYDALGNITSIKKNGTAVSVYEYDSLGRLVRENDCANSTAWVYTYDNAGNLLKKYTFYGLADNVPASHLLSIHPYNGSEISSTYTYSSSAWGDLLTGYNGTSISYDAIGNPTNWRNATGMDWHQRSLTSMSVSGITVSYTYNADGVRTMKTVGTSGHMYVLDGSTILKETIYTAGTVANTLYYYYDESGISGVSYNGTKYTYVKNLQGDVIGIIDSYGATVVEYNYDAWGNILSVTGSMASTLGATNPFRYRGYYYDTESGWYYLNSRYYDPQVGRFINADGIVGANGGIMGYNMFAYCDSNPVMYVDSEGAFRLPFDALRYRGEIHKAVSDHIVTHYNFTAEETIPYTKKRTDLRDAECGVYEIKPSSYQTPARIILHRRQLDRYIDLLGEPYHRGTEKVFGSFEHGDFIVCYYSDGDGLIYYDFQRTIDLDPEDVAEAAKNVFVGAGAALAAGIVASLCNGGRYKVTVDLFE